MSIFLQKTIGELVAEDYRRAAVFSKYKLDFCCKGNRTLPEACEAKNLELDQILADLESITDNACRIPSAENLPPGQLAQYIEKVHHTYVEEAISQLGPYLNKVVSAHGNSNPELVEIAQEFKNSAGELVKHMRKEELILFPYIRKLEEALKEKEAFTKPHFQTIENPVRMMRDEHQAEGERFEKIRSLTNNYEVPEGACNTFRVTYALLEEFEKDLHRHIHLENNILFPQAQQLEKELFENTLAHGI